MLITFRKRKLHSGPTSKTYCFPREHSSSLSTVISRLDLPEEMSQDNMHIHSAANDDSHEPHHIDVDDETNHEGIRSQSYALSRLSSTDLRYT